MKTNFGKIFFMLALIIGIISVAGIVKAEDDDAVRFRGEAINVRFEHLTCQVNLANKQIDILNKYIPTLSITDPLTLSKAKLIADIEQLGLIKNQSNKTAFDDFLKNTLKPDFKVANDAIKNAKKDIRKYNLSNDSRQELKNDLRSAIAEFSTCTSDKEKKIADIKLKDFKHSSDKWEKIIAMMNERNISTMNLTQIAKELQSWIQKLQDAIDSGNETLIRQTIEDFRRQELHLWANFNIERLESYSERMHDYAERYNMTGNISSMRRNIGELRKYIAPGYRYDEGELEHVWETIRHEGKDLNDISKDLLKREKNDMQERRKEMQNERKDNRTLNRTERLDDNESDRNESNGSGRNRGRGGD